MTVDERSRLQLAEALKRALGDDEGITLMELLPPVGWADVATRHDLLVLEGRMDARFESLEGRRDAKFESFERRMDAKFELVDLRFGVIDGHLEVIDTRLGSLDARFADLTREIRGQTWRLMTLMVALVGVVVAAVRL
jgi:hypothetical protein